MNILKRILKSKRREVAAAKKKLPPAKLKRHAEKLIPEKAGRFERALRSAREVRVIAEIKRRSPSKGIIRKDFRPEWIAKRYRFGGAAALSVLTDKPFFGGSLAILRRVRKAVDLPILRKDFIVDAYQLYEARLSGADAVLLIAAALSDRKLRALHAEARRLGLDVLFEVHDEKELSRIKPLRPRLIGVNNRDLKSFRVDLGVTVRLSPRIPKGALLVSESGIFSHEDLLTLRRRGVRAVLVGEALMSRPDPGLALKKLLGESA